MQNPMTYEEAEDIAIRSLGVMSRDIEMLGRFLAVTGIGPGDLRALASTPEFLKGVLEFLLADEATLLSVASTTAVRPTLFAIAHHVLDGPQD